MKNFFLLLSLISNIAYSQYIKGTKSGIPSDLKDKNSIVLFLTPKNYYENQKNTFLAHLQHIGFRYNYYSYLHEAPQIREDQLNTMNLQKEEIIDYLICFEIAEIVGGWQYHLLSVLEIIDNDFNNIGEIYQVNGDENSIYKYLYKSYKIDIPEHLDIKNPHDVVDNKIELFKPEIYPCDIINKELKKLPDDILKSKVALLTFDTIPIKSYTAPIIQNMYKTRNKTAKTANAAMIKEAENLQIEYAFKSRKDYLKLKSEGFKYVYENDMMIQTNNGVNLSPGIHTRYYSYMYLIDLETMDRYILDKYKIVNPYAYPSAIKYLIKQINKMK